MVKLTKREHEVVGHLLGSEPQQQIASKMAISVETLKRHVWNICKKTGGKSSLELQAFFGGSVTQELKDAIAALRWMCDIYTGGLVSVNDCLEQARSRGLRISSRKKAKPLKKHVTLSCARIECVSALFGEHIRDLNKFRQYLLIESAIAEHI